LFAAVLVAVVTNGCAGAAEYSVAYALEVNGKTETGKIENCNSVDTCRIKFRTMDATADLTYFSNASGAGEVLLSIWGDSACCYFRDGNYSTSLDPNKRLHTLTIYAGHARRGNEVVNNQKLGVLYISLAVSR